MLQDYSEVINSFKSDLHHVSRNSQEFKEYDNSKYILEKAAKEMLERQKKRKTNTKI